MGGEVREGEAHSGGVARDSAGACGGAEVGVVGDARGPCAGDVARGGSCDGGVGILEGVA